MDGKIRFWKMATVKKSIYSAAGIAAVVAVVCLGCGGSDCDAPATPSTPSSGTSGDGITISWYRVSDASGYNVYRSTSATGFYQNIGNTVNTNIVDRNFIYGTTYYYKVSAYNDCGESEQSYYKSTKIDCFSSTPDFNSSYTRTATSITMSWSKLTSAKGYYIYRSASQNGTYNRVGTVSQPTTTSANFTDGGLNSDTKYYYKISAYGDCGESGLSGWSGMTTLVCVSSRPNILTSTTTTNSITIEWIRLSDVTGYYVYRSTSSYGTYAHIGTVLQPTIGSVSFTNTGLSSGTTYYYKVSAYKSCGEGELSLLAHSATTRR